MTESATDTETATATATVTASGSARETIATLEIAVAMGLLQPTEVDDAVDCADKIIATLHKMLRKRRA